MSQQQQGVMTPRMDDGPAFGPCCVCESFDNVHTLVMLHRRCAIPGRGWGCIICDLPSDGAVAVFCDKCDGLAPRFVCRGYPATDGRQPFDELPPDEFAHDPAKHGTMEFLPGNRAREANT